MNDTADKGKALESARKAEREERLAAQLRANLKRRKAAARSRSPNSGNLSPESADFEQNSAADAAQSAGNNDPA